jgi:hypothetical protein
MSKSTHIPEVIHGLIDVTGEQEIDTGLRDLQSFVCSPAVINFLPDQEQNVTWYFSRPPSNRYVKIRVEKGGINDGNLGTNPFKVSYIAIGK